MSDSKQNRYPKNLPGRYEEELSLGTADAVAEAPPVRRRSQSGKPAREVGTWDAYKNWLTKVQAPEQRRSLPDPALFSFKGYRSWAEKIRRDWEYEE